MTDRRTFLRALLATPAAATMVLATTARLAGAQAMPEGMARGSQGLNIKNDAERRVFADLLCMCGGCQREHLAECLCGYADDYRAEVRAMMASGMTQEQIKAEWLRRFGPQALSVPPDQGSNRLLYLGPLAAIVGMAAVVVLALKRFRQKAEEKAASAPVAGAPVAGAGRDDYDEKLDEELKQLDNE